MILRGHVFSQVLQMETGLAIVGPEHPVGSGPYSVAYLLHGMCGRSGDWLDYSMLPVYARDYDILFVMPEVARSFYADMKHGQRFFSYVADELPEICARVFNISAKWEDTSVIGASMGGYGALKLALSRPDRYARCCAFSSPCLFLGEYFERWRKLGGDGDIRKELGDQLTDDLEAAFGDEPESTPLDDLPGLAGTAVSGERSPGLYLACGKGDPFLADNRRFKDEATRLGLHVSWEEWDGGHDPYFFDEALKRALRFVSQRN